ncbi:N-acetylmuramoyl-L-alanine amidase [Niallia sp. RD1]|uniref:N-acetylmuramoyl-L-alanine amidase n=1 Tax=Niallia sp. RD1 TaxID=2962858 RepID=UPI00033293C0|nr:N-acetylmuramoyl-L-alanine amidase [Niallia sp. RD1]EOR25230.1 N-acetylmuramoyl-L-alanine amidase [Niallia nealsonii AAU1]UTI44292.1 N-acetylmuramoyl-L-alanine amidase [Niallia sp. RD1]
MKTELPLDTGSFNNLEDKVQYVFDNLLSKKYEGLTRFSEIPDKVKLLSTEINDTELTLNFSKEFTENINNNYNISFLLDSMLNTAFQFKEIESVKFLSNNNKIEIIGDYDFSRPFFDYSKVKITLNSEPTQNIITYGVIAPSNPVIVIDPGHGGSDPGAVGKDGTKESNINLAIAKKVKARFEAKGAKVYMTRTTDKYLTLADRVKVAKDKKANAFISIHINSSTNTSARGTTVIYPNNHDVSNSKTLAQKINSRVTAYLPKHKDPYYQDLHVLRENSMPAVLTETGFISNSSDLPYIKSTKGQDNIAYAIYYGYAQWWGWY